MNKQRISEKYTVIMAEWSNSLQDITKLPTNMTQIYSEG